MPDPFEEEYRDVLQNIESSILSVYQDHPEMTDSQVDSALEALERSYHREAIGGPAVLPKGELSRQVYQAAKLACDWRLGRETAVVDEEEQPIDIKPLNVGEIEACLKRIRKSLQLWNKDYGTRGYLNYIKTFFS